jgi:DNA-binding winged helix-turn-helix (wHTH) protein
MSHVPVARVMPVPLSAFAVGEWRVSPDLNQLSRAGQSAHVRPQLMDLLVYLAQNSGRTVSRDELQAQVWPTQPFITMTALPRCIAELRQALGDRATDPTMIQTVPKRGYRLIAPVHPIGEGLPAETPSLGEGDANVTAADVRPERQLLAWLRRARAFAARVCRPLLVRAG